MSKRKFFAFALCFLAALISISCSAAFTVEASQNGEVAVKCNAGLGAAFMDVMHQINGTQADSPLMTVADCADMAASLSSAGLSSAIVRTPTQESVEVAGKVFAMGKASSLLTSAGCITLSQAGEKRRVTLALNAVTLRALYEKLDEEVQVYLDLSMAGVFSGESMSAKEWLEALETVYGKAFADEAAKASVTISMKVESAEGKSVKKTFVVPLADIMTGKNTVCEAEG